MRQEASRRGKELDKSMAMDRYLATDNDDSSIRIVVVLFLHQASLDGHKCTGLVDIICHPFADLMGKGGMFPCGNKKP